MSTGGIFTLITNDGKQDRLLMASEFLKQRLAKIQAERKSQGLEPTPTLVDIEKTHLLFMNSHFKPFAAIGFEYNKVGVASGAPQLGSTVQFSIPQFGDFFQDMALHLILSDPVPTSGTTPTYRWCQYPGERIMSRVKFTVNGNPLDEYFADDYVLYRKTQLPEQKRAGYNRCMGQENPIVAEYYQASVSPTNSRLMGMYANGFQTPKTVHGQLELMIPLLFWFNTDIRFAIPSVSIPYGQRFIEVEFADQASLVGQEARGTAIDGTLGTVSILKCMLYINNIFVNPEIHDIYIKRIGFNLIRVHRRHLMKLDVASEEVLLSNLKWPIEMMHLTFRPIENTAVTSTDFDGNGTGAYHLDHWHTFSRVVRSDVTGNQLTAYVDIQSPTVNHLTLLSHGVRLFDEYPASFFTSYLPLVRGKNNRTPDDIGIHTIYFNAVPCNHQPSGYINVSRAREFYLKYDSNQFATPISTSKIVNLTVNACALNFLLIADGSAVLRYST